MDGVANGERSGGGLFSRGRSAAGAPRDCADVKNGVFRMEVSVGLLTPQRPVYPREGLKVHTACCQGNSGARVYAYVEAYLIWCFSNLFKNSGSRGRHCGAAG